MKTLISKTLLTLAPLVLCGGCNFMQVSSPTVGFANPNRMSVVEKAWMARHEYDPKTGLLADQTLEHPMSLQPFNAELGRSQ